MSDAEIMEYVDDCWVRLGVNVGVNRPPDKVTVEGRYWTRFPRVLVYTFNDEWWLVGSNIWTHQPIYWRPIDD